MSEYQREDKQTVRYVVLIPGVSDLQWRVEEIGAPGEPGETVRQRVLNQNTGVTTNLASLAYVQSYYPDVWQVYVRENGEQ